MAQRYYGLNNLPTQWRRDDVVTGTSTGSTDIEVRIDTAKSWTRIEIEQALNSIIRRIQTGTDDLAVI